MTKEPYPNIKWTAPPGAGGPVFQQLDEIEDWWAEHWTKRHVEPFMPYLEKLINLGHRVPSFLPKNPPMETFLAGMLLRRTMNDLRSTWLLCTRGYVSQAASVAAGLFEHGLSAVAVVTDEQRGKDFVLRGPLGPQKLSNILAEEESNWRARVGQELIQRHKREYAEEVYRSYRFLCSMKHPDVQSVIKDAAGTYTIDSGFMCLVFPSYGSHDYYNCPLILLTAMSVTHAAIFYLALKAFDSNDDVAGDVQREYLMELTVLISEARRLVSEITDSPVPEILTRELKLNYAAGRSSTTQNAERAKGSDAFAENE